MQTKKEGLQKTLSSGKMEIKQEDFDKLKQLDRIEYRQKERKIKEWNEGSWGFPFLSIICFCMILMILLLPQLYIVGKINGGVSIMDIIFPISFFMGFCMVFCFAGFAVDIIFATKRKITLKEMQEKYFNFKVEVNK